MSSVNSCRHVFFFPSIYNHLSLFLPYIFLLFIYFYLSLFFFPRKENCENCWSALLTLSDAPSSFNVSFVYSPTPAHSFLDVIFHLISPLFYFILFYSIPFYLCFLSYSLARLFSFRFVFHRYPRSDRVCNRNGAKTRNCYVLCSPKSNSRPGPLASAAKKDERENTKLGGELYCTYAYYTSAL